MDAQTSMRIELMRDLRNTIDEYIDEPDPDAVLNLVTSTTSMKDPLTTTWRDMIDMMIELLEKGAGDDDGMKCVNFCVLKRRVIQQQDRKKEPKKLREMGYKFCQALEFFVCSILDWPIAPTEVEPKRRDDGCEKGRTTRLHGELRVANEELEEETEEEERGEEVNDMVQPATQPSGGTSTMVMAKPREVAPSTSSPPAAGTPSGLSVAAVDYAEEEGAQLKPSSEMRSTSHLTLSSKRTEDSASITASVAPDAVENTSLSKYQQRMVRRRKRLHELYEKLAPSQSSQMPSHGSASPPTVVMEEVPSASSEVMIISSTSPPEAGAPEKEAESAAPGAPITSEDSELIKKQKLERKRKLAAFLVQYEKKKKFAAQEFQKPRTLSEPSTSSDVTEPTQSLPGPIEREPSHNFSDQPSSLQLPPINPFPPEYHLGMPSRFPPPGPYQFNQAVPFQHPGMPGHFNPPGPCNFNEPGSFEPQRFAPGFPMMQPGPPVGPPPSFTCPPCTLCFSPEHPSELCDVYASRVKRDSRRQELKLCIHCLGEHRSKLCMVRRNARCPRCDGHPGIDVALCPYMCPLR